MKYFVLAWQAHVPDAKSKDLRYVDYNKKDTLSGIFWANTEYDAAQRFMAEHPGLGDDCGVLVIPGSTFSIKREMKSD